MNTRIEIQHDQLIEALKYAGYKEEIYHLLDLFERATPKLQKLFSAFTTKKTPEKPANHVLEKITDILGQSGRIARTFNKNRFLLFYYSNSDDQILIHEVKKDQHIFSFCNTKDEFANTLKRWYDAGKAPSVKEIEMGNLEYTYEEFNRLYHYSPEKYEEILQDNSLHPNVRQLTADFLHHGLDVEQCGFFDITHSKQINVNVIVFFLPGALVTWRLEFEKHEEKMVTISPIEGDIFYHALQEDLLHHLMSAN